MLLFVPCITVVLLVKVKRPKVQRDCVCVWGGGGGGRGCVRVCVRTCVCVPSLLNLDPKCEVDHLQLS